MAKLTGLLERLYGMPDIRVGECSLEWRLSRSRHKVKPFKVALIGSHSYSYTRFKGTKVGPYTKAFLPGGIFGAVGSISENLNFNPIKRRRAIVNWSSTLVGVNKMMKQ